MLKLAKRVAIFVAGSLLVVAGAIGLVLPILPGILLLLAGAFLLQYEWPWPYQMLLKLGDRFPAVKRSTTQISSWQVKWWTKAKINPAIAGSAEQHVVTRKILIFDENAEDLALHAKAFEAQGLQVSRCISLESAMQCIEREEFDFALVDQASPAFDGQHIIKHLLRRNVSMPFVVMARPRDEQCRQQALDLGAADYMEKPVSTSDMDLVMQNHFRSSSKK